ncbi:hypothetical protein BB560_006731 [Smittium megazygosporum]|uniref:Uncharacterized protein n=1 Tax=Smittium megazygosporum TaxID=133381 RepID=A0A2T9Y283_9FUNG|nr:hypothetical protein BB560_006731 [Smittium megazygosporum]
MEQRCPICSGGTYSEHIRLTDWLCQQFWQRAGPGLSGLTCMAFGAEKLLLTDANLEVLNLCKENAKINSKFSNDVKVQLLDWLYPDQLQAVPEVYDVIIGSDLVYDPDIIPNLINVLESLLTDTKQIAYITSTVRKSETFNTFIELLEKSPFLSFSTMDISEITPTVVHSFEQRPVVKLNIIAKKELDSV